MLSTRSRQRVSFAAMTDAAPPPTPKRAARQRRLVCELCGAPFDCTLDGDCWCAAEVIRATLPDQSGADDAPKDCLCPVCLRTRFGSAATQDRVV